MPRDLKTSESEQRDHVAHVQTVSAGIETGIEGEGPSLIRLPRASGSVQSANNPRHWSSSRMFIRGEIKLPITDFQLPIGVRSGFHCHQPTDFATGARVFQPAARFGAGRG